jgi:hypothetical protein
VAGPGEGGAGACLEDHDQQEEEQEESEFARHGSSFLFYPAIIKSFRF